MNCSAPECIYSAHAKGLCSTHYARMRHYGSLDVPPLPPPPLWCRCSEPLPGVGFWSIGCDRCGRMIRPMQRVQRKEKAA